MLSCPRTAPRRRPWLAVSLVPLLLAASCTASSRAPAARAPARAPLASFAPFTSKLRVPGFTGSCPATAATRYSGRTVVIPLRILTPSPVISQIFVGVCLNGHGPYPFIVDTGSSHTIVDAALARRLGLVSASAASGMHACGGTARDATVRLSAGPFVFGQDRQVLITGLASPSAPLMGILGADELSSFGIDRIDYQAQTLTVPAPETVGSVPDFLVADGSLGSGTLQRYSPVVIDYRHHELLLGPLRPGT
jgi:hypothetical protein